LRVGGQFVPSVQGQDGPGRGQEDDVPEVVAALEAHGLVEVTGPGDVAHTQGDEAESLVHGGHPTGHRGRGVGHALLVTCWARPSRMRSSPASKSVRTAAPAGSSEGTSAAEASISAVCGK